MEVEGKIVDVLNEVIYPGKIKIEDKKIKQIERKDDVKNQYILPGFVDSHIHVESTMLPPLEFARVAVQHGTVATVSDPHEIANVLGIEGIEYMIKDSKKVPLKFYFGVPSCVPSTSFDTSGAKIGPKKIDELFSNYDCSYLGEVMNYPAVINEEKEMMEKLEIAKRYTDALDGHAPGLSGKDLEKYISAGITTDHECITIEECMEKINRGMKIQIREGSLSKKLDEFYPLLEKYPDKCMFCSDDRHPDDLEEGHINSTVKKALEHDIPMMDTLKAASVIPVKHYDLDLGLLQKGDKADFIVVDDIENLEIKDVFIDGKNVYDGDELKFSRAESDIINNFETKKKEKDDFRIKPQDKEINVISIDDKELITKRETAAPKVKDGNVVSDLDRDVLKLSVINRYSNQNPSLGFAKGFGIKEGALATSISHDSHNVIGVGTTDVDLCKAVNKIIENKGGMCVITDEKEKCLPLPIAGLMSDNDYTKVSEDYKSIKELSKRTGSELRSPFMTLSFLSLLVIPEIKISDKGLFDVNKLEFIDLFE